MQNHALAVLEQLAACRNEMPLFHPIDLEISAGQCIEVLGDNGTGKSTLLRTLAGFHEDYIGHFDCSEVLYQGHSLGLDPLLSPYENLRWHNGLAAGPAGSEQDSDADVILAGLALVGLLAEAHTPVQQLSAGQQRRAGMARWPSAPQPVWLLDEPFNALDVNAKRLVNALIEQKCAAGGAVICATHLPVSVADKITLQLTAADSVESC
tara:strand:+ start:2616 stop:3242 length:627 start_codon:yes stop_codon:yes gene_type:complete